MTKQEIIDEINRLTEVQSDDDDDITEIFCLKQMLEQRDYVD